MKIYCFLATLLFITGNQEAHAFGKKKMNIVEINGQSESQVVKTDDAVKVMLRGKVAELFFRVIKGKKEMIDASPVASYVKGVTHSTVYGKNIQCSKIEKKTKVEYACGFSLSPNAQMASAVEPYSQNQFRFSLTNNTTKFFPKSQKARALASAENVAFNEAGAYLVYSPKEKPKNAKNAMLILKGNSAKEVMSYMVDEKAKSFKKGSVMGWKGQNIACVQATDKEPERCALVVALEDGSFTSDSNPLY